jgi:F-type H+-transporting ATPase subunit a
MKYSPDQYILWERSFVQINLTLVFTWVVMAIIIFFEIIIDFIEEQILKIGGNDISNTVPFITTLFIFILFSNILSLIPKFISPTGSLSTVTALSISVIIMDIFYRTKRAGVAGYFKKYLKPSPVMLPLNIITNFSGAVSMAIRLYGNIMSGFIISLVLLQVAFLTLGFPVFVQLITLVTSVVQAYIFSVLAMIYIS